MDVKVNDAEWSSLAAADRSRIESIITGFFKDAKIVPDPSAPASSSHPAAASLLKLPKPVCVAACNVAEAAAVAACTALGNPILIAACVAAAHEAGNACRNAC